MAVVHQPLLNLVDDVSIAFERDFQVPRPTQDVLRDPARAQLKYYNEHDLAGFLSCFDEGVTVEDGDGDVLFSGHKQMYRVYNGVFESKVRAEVTNEMRVGDWVVHHQVVHGLPSADELDKQILEKSSLDKPLIKEIQSAPLRSLKLRTQSGGDGEAQEVVAAYRVQGGLIRKVVLLR